MCLSSYGENPLQSRESVNIWIALLCFGFYVPFCKDVNSSLYRYKPTDKKTPTVGGNIQEMF